MHKYSISFASIILFARILVSKQCAFDDLTTTLVSKPLLNAFQFASYYQDHMVLQRHPHSAIIWGFGKINSTVTLTLNDATYTTVVIASNEGIGVWKIALKPHLEGGPYTIAVNQTFHDVSEDSIHLKDIYFGEVWLCSGQSNMQMALTVILNSTFEINDTINYPYVRVFYVSNLVSETEEFDLKGISMPWSIPNPGNMKLFSAVCWLYGKYLYNQLKVPIGLVHSSWGGTPVETWSSPRALHSCGLDHSKQLPLPNPNPQNNSLLWNSMIHPLLNMTIKGVVWYQGEQNTIYHRSSYNCSFPTMISDWRKYWYEGTSGSTDPDFAFGLVQLSVLNEANWYDDGAYSEIRWHQTADHGFVANSKMPNTFMAVTIDLLDTGIPYGSPHYRDKQDVSKRLALGAVNHVYGNKLVISDGPYPINAYHSSVFEITVEYDGKQTLALNKVQSFQICCVQNACGVYDTYKNKEWTNSSVITWTDHSIVLDASDCLFGANAVRYAWSVTPCSFKNCQVYNNQNLPAAPFVIDLNV